jgi:serine protease
MAQSLRPPRSCRPARVIVKYRADSEMTKKQAMTATGRRTLQAQVLGDQIGVPLVAGAGISDRSHVVTARGLSSASLAARLGALADVEYAVVDERKHIVAVPNDTFMPAAP